MITHMFRNVFLVVCLLVSMPAYAQKSNSNGFTYDNSLPVEITADTLEVMQDKNIAIFSGKVDAIQGKMNLKAQKMVVHYLPKEQRQSSEQNSISKIIATGDVFLTTPNESAKGESGTFNIQKNTITLIDNVVVSRGKTVVKGDTLVYNLNTGKSTLNGSSEATGTNKTKKQRVKGVFVPGNSDN